jgi:ribosome-binding protein aMBF1 (putative translation factor)
LQNEKELDVTIRTAMRKKNLKKDQLARMLGISSTMVEKLVCGEIVPSRHLEKKMIEILGVSELRLMKLSRRRDRRSSTTKSGTKRRKAA